MYGPDVVHLCLPIGLEHGDVVQLENHVGMLEERLLGLVLVVLRGYADDDAALAQLLHPHLKLREGLADAQAVAELDSLQPVVAYHSAPKGVVQVQDEAFLELSPAGADDVHHPAGHVGDSVDAEHHLRADVDVGVEHEVAAQLVLQPSDVADEQVGVLLGKFHQSEVEFAHLIGERRLHLVGVGAEHRVLNLRIVEADDLLAAQCGCLGYGLHKLQPLAGQGDLLLRREHAVLLAEFVGGLEKDDELGVVFVELAVGIHELLVHLVVLGLEEVDVVSFGHA